MELDPKYVDTAVRRWREYAGEEATHAESGKTFDDIQAERRVEKEADHGE